MKEYYQIGEISKLYNVSTDTLRYYEKIGVLKPKRLQNGYRVYRITDIWRLNLIRDLRKLDFSMSTIKEYLINRSVASSMKLHEKEIEAIKEDLDFLEQVKNNLEGLNSYIDKYTNKTSYDVIRVKYIHERKCLRSTEPIRNDAEVELILNKLMRKYENVLFSLENSLSGSTISISNLEKEIYNEPNSVFFVIEDEEKNPKPVYESYNYILEEGYYICCVFKGAYKKLNTFWKEMLIFAEKEGYVPVGDFIELDHIDLYLTDKPEEFVTELQIKVEKKK